MTSWKKERKGHEGGGLKLCEVKQVKTLKSYEVIIGGKFKKEKWKKKKSEVVIKNRCLEF